MPSLAGAGGYLSTELQRLDLLLHREILRLRASYQLSLDEFRGLYVSDEQVNQLIDQALGREGATPATEELTEQAERLRQSSPGRDSEYLLWSGLASEFSLSRAEQDVLLLAVAPEIDLKYETLYAYLNNDVTRKWPTRDLALRLFSTNAEEMLDVRRCLMAESTLFGSGLLQMIQPSQPGRLSWQACGFTVAPAVFHHLLGSTRLDPCLDPLVEERRPAVDFEHLPFTDEQLASLSSIAGLGALSSSKQPTPLVVLTGREGSGRRLAAEAVCRELGLSVLRVDLEALRAAAWESAQLVRAILLQQRLLGAGLYLERSEALFDKEGQPAAEARRLINRLMQSRQMVFMACEAGSRWRELAMGHRVVSFHFDEPDYVTRLRLWERAFEQNRVSVERAEVEALADRFVLTPGQIESAASAAADARLLDCGQSPKAHGPSSLFAAARSESDQGLGDLAPKVRTIHRWEDLILPRVTLQRVKEVAAAIRFRHVVYSEWGFDGRIASGKGLKALFAGASGTGKTMAASVIARELGLELYKIDLSAIVSKYIGETEKNLDRIFRAAQSSNSILFFDEADALFGKRSEVKDAHDRYANIEVAYLLQKVEEYEGVVILASNLSKNIDNAFSRRMHVVVEFPLPDETHREKLWRGMFPPQTPLGADVDFRFLARQFQIAGGDIRNVALEAAFLAAQDGRVVTMKQLIKALARQMIKQGRIPSPTDFKQYHELIAEDA